MAKLTKRWQDANYRLTSKKEKNMKAPNFICLLLIMLGLACGSDQSDLKANNALEGGRYFIENCMKGDFKKAKLFLLDNPSNKTYFDSLSSHYFSLDKEQRQLLREASIQVNEIINIDSTHGSFSYQNSLDKTPQKIMVVATPEGWKVDLQYSYTQKIK